MRRKNRFETSVINEQREIVPWLAARGPLHYMPEKPPKEDALFQYGWILPELFSEKISLRNQHYFGCWPKEDSKELFSFWNQARAGGVERVAVHWGKIEEHAVHAPMAIYSCVLGYRELPSYVLIQHGSYQVIPASEQPWIEMGYLGLYRGVGKAKKFTFSEKFSHENLNSTNREIWHRYLATQAEILSDASLSFQSIHDRTARCETAHLKDRSGISNEIADKYGLDLKAKKSFSFRLWDTTHQSFALERWVAERKFGPHFVVARTPVSNVRILTFFAGEAEVRIIDPNQLEMIEAKGCEPDLRDIARK